MNEPPITVAAMRKDLGEVLNRAFYRNEIVEIAKREKPFALVVSHKRLPVVEGIELLADDIKMESGRLVRLLQAVPKEDLLALLREARDGAAASGDPPVAAAGTKADQAALEDHE